MRTSNLTSKPSWLDYYPNAEKPDVNTNFGFDSTGMWFSGTADDVSYPIRTNYDIDGTKKTEIVFTFLHDENCSDHSVCVFNTDFQPEWSWGTSTTRISFQVDCGTPEASGLTLEGEGAGSTLSIGNTYTCKIVYDPTVGTFTYEVFDGTSATGSAINSFTLNEALPAGPYRIGFDADRDNFPQKSYFTYLSISGEVFEPYPYPEVIFRVKTFDPLQFVGQNFPDSNINNILLNLQNQTVWIENWPYALKNGDEFTLYGEQALQTLNAYTQINPGGTQLELVYYGVKGGYDPNPTGVGGSMLFNGTSTYLTVPASSDWAVGTGDFTVEWFQYQENASSNERVFSVNTWPTASIACSMESSVNTFYFWTNGNLINGGDITSIYNTWAHIAACRSSGTLYLFVNGTQVYSGANTDDITDNTNPLYIGAESSGSYFQGLITNFQFVKGSALYTANFTPPSAPITPDANSKLCLLVSSESALLTDSSLAAKTATNNGVTFSASTPF